MATKHNRRNRAQKNTVVCLPATIKKRYSAYEDLCSRLFSYDVVKIVYTYLSCRCMVSKGSNDLDICGNESACIGKKCDNCGRQIEGSLLRCTEHQDIPIMHVDYPY